MIMETKVREEKREGERILEGVFVISFPRLFFLLTYDIVSTVDCPDFRSQCVSGDLTH